MAFTIQYIYDCEIAKISQSIYFDQDQTLFRSCKTYAVHTRPEKLAFSSTSRTILWFVIIIILNDCISIGMSIYKVYSVHDYVP